MKDTYCIIMAGGIGSRFWPMSRTEMPKQFLDVLGSGRSLIQQTVDRFKRIMPVENIYIVTNKIYKEIILEQMPDLTDDQVLLEPAMRNTAPCIAYATYKIMSKNPNASFVVAPSDHLITKEDEFLNFIKQGVDFVTSNEQLLTLGIKPSRPETGYGYIQVEDSDPKIGGLYKVKTFTEKPNIDLAKVFYESGEFFWNAGIFMWSGKTIVNAFEKDLPDVASKFSVGKDLYYTSEEAAFIDEAYPSCKNISIDYGIMEGADNVHVLCAEFGWYDLGTWGSLYEHLHQDENGNATWNSDVLLYDCKDNIVKMADGKVAVIHGLEGYIIVESGKSMLICKKDDEQRIKQFVTDVKLHKGSEYV